MSRATSAWAEAVADQIKEASRFSPVPLALIGRSRPLADGTQLDPGKQIADFATLVAKARSAGFIRLDIDVSLLGWEWLTDTHVDAIQAILDEAGVRVVSYSGSFGRTLDELKMACACADALGASVLSGDTTLLSTDPTAVVRALDDSDLLFAVRGREDRTPSALLARIPDNGEGLIGVTADLSHWAARGHSPSAAISQLGGSILHVCVSEIANRVRPSIDLRKCLSTLRASGYLGPVAIMEPLASVEAGGELA